MKLQHGTTRGRAERILSDGPSPRYCEPGGGPGTTGFSMCVAGGPFPFGTPDQYARGKAREFPNEGGPAIVEVEVPDTIVALAIDDWFPLSQGLIQFDAGSGLEELLRLWPDLDKRVVLVDIP